MYMGGTGEPDEFRYDLHNAKFRMPSYPPQKSNESDQCVEPTNLLTLHIAIYSSRQGSQSKRHMQLIGNDAYMDWTQ